MDNNEKLFTSTPYLKEMMLMDNEAAKIGLGINEYIKK